MSRQATHQPQPLWHGLAAGVCATMSSRVLTCAPRGAGAVRGSSIILAEGMPATDQRPLTTSTDPADTVKARLQVQGANPLHAGQPRLNTAQMISQVRVRRAGRCL